MNECADDCLMCSGEACRLCGAGCYDSSVRDCEHDVIERHQSPPIAFCFTCNRAPWGAVRDCRRYGHRLQEVVTAR